MRNLLEETKEYIDSIGLKIEDITFIGSSKTNHECSWEEFCILANQKYDSGFGAQEVARDLIIGFQGGERMWRDEYVGSEGWEHSLPFIKSGQKNLPIKRLIGGTWNSIEEMEELEEYA